MRYRIRSCYGHRIQEVEEDSEEDSGSRNLAELWEDRQSTVDESYQGGIEALSLIPSGKSQGG